MSSDQLETLVQWHSYVLSGTNEQRMQATKGIEEAKQSLRWDCASAGLTIAERSTSEQLAFFGFHLMDEAVNKYYHTVDLNTRAAFRTKLLQLSASAQSRLLTEKLSQLIADTAKHDWPQNYPDFFPQLITLPQAVVTTTLRILFEDIKESTTEVGLGAQGTSKWDCKVHLSPAKKRELITGVRSVSGELLRYLLNDLQSQQASVSSILCLTALLELVRIEEIVSSGIVEVVLSLFGSLDPSSAEWSAVCDCVRELCTQPSEKSVVVVQTVTQFILMYCVQFHSRPCSGSEEHAAIRSLAACIAATLPFTRAPDYNLLSEEVMGEVVSAGVCLLKVPSVPVACTIIPALINVATAGFTKNMIELPTILREILADNISDPECEEGLEFPHLSWSADVWEAEEWRHTFAELRKEAKQLLGFVVKAHAVEVYRQLLAIANELHQGFSKRHERDEQDSTGEIVACSRQAVAWESASYVFTACLVVPLQEMSVAPELSASLMACFKVESKDAAIVSSMAGLVGGLGSLYRVDGALLHAGIDKLFSLMRHRRDFEVGSNVLSPATTAARKKVMNNFVKLCSTRSTEMAPLMEPLLSFAGGLIGGELQGGEVSSICEGLTRISNQMPDESQVKVLEIIARPALEMMGEMPNVSSPQALAQLLQQPHSDSSRKLLYVASTFSGVFRHTKKMMLHQLAEQLLQPVLTALQSIAALHSNARSCLPEQLRPMLEPQKEQEQWGIAKSDDVQHLESAIEFGREFLLELREAFLELLAGIAAITPSMHTHYESLNVGAIATGLTLPSMRAFFFHFSIYFIYNCPAQCVSVAGKFTNATCRMAGQSIGKLYDAAKRAEDEVSPAIREVGMLAVDLLVRVGRARQTETNEVAVTQHLLGDPTPATALIYLAAATFVWGDEGVTTKALTALRKVLPTLVRNDAVHQHLYVLYGMCLRRLQCAKLKEGIGCRIGHDSKEDKLLDGCVATAAALLHAMARVNRIFVSTLQRAGVTTADTLVEEILVEPHEGRRISAVRAALAQYVAGKSQASPLELPTFADLPFPDRYVPLWIVRYERVVCRMYNT